MMHFIEKPLHPKQVPFLSRLLYDYSVALKPLNYAAYVAKLGKHDKEAIALAEQLIDIAQTYDIYQTLAMIDQPFAHDIPRNLDEPPDFTHPAIIGQPWADDPDHPLLWDERWNTGRRATNTHCLYGLDAHDRPVNPYLNYGITGRGMIGRFGPNHAVDAGIVDMKPGPDGQPLLHMLGIVRQDNGKPALCGGFTEFESPYRYGQHDIIRTQTHEVFEELISGSVALLPRYAAGLDHTIAAEIAKQSKNYTLSERDIDILTRQMTTACKLKQVQEQDPQFLENIQSLFTHAQTCYSGPVLNSHRNTNGAWMETHLSCITLDPTTWDHVKGSDPFGYDFVAGDDAQDVLWHPITPDLIDQATGSHSAYACFLLSSHLLTAKHDDPHVLDSAKHQADTLIKHLTKRIFEPSL